MSDQQQARDADVTRTTAERRDLRLRFDHRVRLRKSDALFAQPRLLHISPPKNLCPRFARACHESTKITRLPGHGGINFIASHSGFNGTRFVDTVPTPEAHRNSKLMDASPTSTTDVLFTALAFSFAGGGLGGLVASINICSPNEIHVPGHSGRVRLGVIGDILIGGAAGIAVLFLIAAPADGKQLSLLHAFPLSILAGVAGNRLLFGMSNAILGKVMSDQERIVSKLDTMQRVSPIIQEGEENLKKSNYALAEKLFRKAIKVDPSNSLSYINLGKALKRRSTEVHEAADRENLLRQAIDAVTTAIELNPASDRAYYNRACYRALVNDPLDLITADLETAFDLFPASRQFAIEDDDFRSIRDKEEFQRIATQGKTDSANGGAMS